MSKEYYDPEEDYIDFVDDGPPCPACGHPSTNSRSCDSCDEFHEEVYCIDDICLGQGWCMHGDGMGPCRECHGTGYVLWCPKCGADYYRALCAKKSRELESAKGAAK